MQLDQNSTAALLGLFGVVNTALLVYQAVRLGQVHGAVNGAQRAAVEAAHNAGVVRGLLGRPMELSEPHDPASDVTST
jgi:2-methylcitrate dehydratase PrpD